MLNTSERRISDREEKYEEVRLGRIGARIHRCENAIIEDEGGKGVRVRSGANIRVGDVLTLYVGEDNRRMDARVIWARQDGLIEKRETGRPGKAWLAGLRLKTMRRKKQRAVGGIKGNGLQKALVATLRLAVFGAGLVLLGAIVWGASVLASMMTG